jgi:NADH:ubiquinone reductase (H+-translocating)
LIGVRNRLSVAINWLWIYARDQRGARLITWWGSQVEGTEPFPRHRQD